MTGPTPRGDWDRWQTDWLRTGAATGPAEALPGLMGRARRAWIAPRLIEGATAAVALLVTAAALRHAANAFEAALGLVVGVSIGALWVQRILLRRREEAAAGAESVQHLVVLRTVRAKELRLAHFIWVVLALEVAFLIPWWVIGTRVHHRTLGDVGSWLTVWLPITGMIALLAWSVRLARSARSEVRAIEWLYQQYREELM